MNLILKIGFHNDGRSFRRVTGVPLWRQRVGWLIPGVRRIDPVRRRGGAWRRSPQTHPLTAPNVRPRTICFWMKRDRINTGRVMIVAAAVRPPQLISS